METIAIELMQDFSEIVPYEHMGIPLYIRTADFGIISRIIGGTGTVCPEFIFYGSYHWHYGFSSAVLGETGQGIRGKKYKYRILEKITYGNDCD